MTHKAKKAKIDMTCGVCSESLSGKAVFMAECMHIFHFTCITKPCCPVCQTTWKNNLPFLPSQTPHTTFSFSDDDPLPPVPNPPPLSKVMITAVPERPAVARSESLSEFAIHVRIKAPSLPKNPSLRTPIDLVAIIDVSASMKGPKVALAKQALHFTIDNLGPHDRLSIISFSHEAQRALPLRRMTEEGRSAAKLAVDSFSFSAAAAAVATDILVGLTTGNRVLEERRYASGIFNTEGSHEGRVHIGDLYAEEEKEFLVVVSGESVEVGFGPVRIKRPKYVEVEDMGVSAEVDRGRNRICVAKGIKEARRMAERGEMEGARGVVAERRRVVMESVAGVAGDGMCKWLEQEMEEMEKRLVNEGMYRKGGRAFAFAIMSSHAMQRATVKGVAASGGAYMTRYMTEMVVGSRGLDDAHGKD
ncbi:zinc finger C3HC4-type RING finger family protein [Striga asiatica]|uniref:Zinc finger C3HC4-type RING finger family protein n=1 Tax=Striga asiatica TaxID=4170 RepID=A0A5A7R1K0_STRAF|nr:zinc finger C3HC4-type RING finger family protein [Striga asiatica]